MAFDLLPFEEEGNFISRWWRTLILPFRAPGERWDQVYRGSSPLAPLAFAALTFLAALPLPLLAGWLGFRALDQAFHLGPAHALVYLLSTFPERGMVYLLLPLLLLGPGTLLAHGLLALLEPGAQGQLRGSFRALAYGWAWWIIPAAGLAAWLLWLHLAPWTSHPTPLKTITSWGLDGHPAALKAHRILVAAAGAALALSLARGLARVHGSVFWKTLPAVLLTLGAALAAARPLGDVLARRVKTEIAAPLNLGRRPQAFRAAGDASLQGMEQLGGFLEEVANEARLTPGERDNRARFMRLWELVEQTRDQAQADMERCGLPALPRTVDLLTAGDWGVGIDVQQARRSGFAPSCQLIYRCTLSSLKGLVDYCAVCVGDPPEAPAKGGPGPLLPRDLSEAAGRMQQRKPGPDQLGALNAARRAFTAALDRIQMEIGPFAPDEPGAVNVPQGPGRGLPPQNGGEQTMGRPIVIGIRP